MHRMPSRNLQGFIFITILIVLAFGLTPNREALAAVTNEQFDGFGVGTTAEGLTVPGIDTLLSAPGGSTLIGISNPAIIPPFSGNALVNTTGGTLSITFSQPQNSYTFDYETNDIAAGTFTVQAFRVGAVVSTNDIPVATGQTVSNVTDTPGVFDQIVISSTKGEWGLDNLTTTDAPAAVSIVETFGDTHVSEAGVTDSYDIALDSPPTAPITINLTTPDNQCTVLPTSLNFAINDVSPQTVTVAAVNDLVAETTPHTCVIQHTIAPTGDLAYDGLLIPDLNVDVDDNDAPGVTLSKTDVNLAENGAPDTYTVVLTSDLTIPVTIGISGGLQCLVNGSASTSLTFNPSGGSAPFWNDPQTVTVDAVDNQIHDGLHTCTITHSATNPGEPNYNKPPLIIADVTGHITDDDISGVTITPLTLPDLFEQNTTSSDYTIELDTAPQQVVTVTITPDAQCSTSTLAVSFPIGDMGPQTITVTAIDDPNPEASPHNCLIDNVFASADTDYNSITIQVTAPIIDNDTPGINLTPTTPPTVNVTEGGGTDSYTLSLASSPVADVTISITPDAECTIVSPASPITISAAAPTPVLITVQAVDDSVIESSLVHPCVIQHVVIASGADYTGIFNDLTVNVTDNDNPGVTIAPQTLNLAEGSPGQNYTVVLTSQPTNPVTITVSGDAQCTVNGGATATLTFNPSGAGIWNVPQSVTVAAIDDLVAENPPHTCMITHVAASADTNYDGINITIPDVVGTITDNDTNGVTVAPQTLNLAEGSPGQNYTVVLDSQPTNAVTITVSGDAQCTVNGGATATLTFNPSGVDIWNVAQTITVAAIDDLVSEPGLQTCTITHVAGSGDTNYNLIPIANVVGTITDNDNIGVTVAPLTVNVTEGQPGQNYTIVLTSQPTNQVIITVSGDTQCTVNGGATTTLTFDNVTWNTAQPVTVAAIDDIIVEASPHPCTITHAASSLDTNYDGISIPPVAGSITDNDAPGVTVAPLTVNVTEGQAGQNYTVVLNTQPTAPVTITVSVASQCTVNGAATTTLTFDSVTWNAPQSVLVTAIDDTVVEASPHTCTITHAASSSDTNYNAIIISNVIGNITDDDTPTGPVYSSNPPPLGTLTITPPGVGQATSGTVRVTNVGIGMLTITGVSVSGTTHISALLPPPAQQNLGANQFADIDVQCDANFTGTATGTLSITHNGSGAPIPATYTVNCTIGSASGPGYGSFPSPGTIINVGTVLIGSPIAASLLVTETGGSTLRVDLPLGGAITGPNVSEFSITSGSPPFNIPDGGTAQTIVIQCVPLAQGLRIATLTFFTNDPLLPSVSYLMACVGSLVPVTTPTPFGFVPTEVPPTATIIIPATGQVIEVKGLSVRTGPYLGATLINVARPGTSYSILAQNRDEGQFTWYLIKIGRQSGWVSGRFLAVTGTIDAVPFSGSIFDQIDNPPDIGVRLTTNAIIDMRRRPSPRTSRVGTIPAHTEVIVLGRTVEEKQTFWIQVSYNGTVGWIPALPVTMRGPVTNLPVW